MTRSTFTANAALLAALAHPAAAQVAQGTFTSVIQFTGTSGPYLSVTPQGLTLDASGNLFGVTGGGGTNGAGTIYEYTPSTNTFITLVQFTGNNGTAPGMFASVPLVSDGQGNLYGNTVFGGSTTNGNLFEYTPATNTFTNLVSFTGGSGTASPGSKPTAPLAPDGMGNFYGTTTFGGTNNVGTLYEYSPSTGTFTNVFSFTGSSGAHPGSGTRSGLTPDGQGNFYGTTSGSIFEYTPSTGAFINRVSFTGTSGAAPGFGSLAGFTSDGQGNFYGTTYSGGASNNGTLFKYTPSTNIFTNLVQFTGTAGMAPGRSPQVALVLDGAGNFFGTTFNGGTSDKGTVFEYAPSTGTFTSLVSFTGGTGAVIGSNPEYGLVINGSGTLYGTTDYTVTNGSGSGNGTLWSLSGVAVAPAPEPSAYVMWGIGALGMGALGLRARRRTARA